MCIVIAKPLGQKWPKREYIKESANNNPDGFAMSWAYKGKLCRYTTMKKDEFLRMYESLSSRLDENKTAMLIHARIKTHGSVSQKNCHCWVEGNISFAHNGILSIKNRDDMTDSETFFRDIFLPVYKGGGWTAAERAINAVIGSSKFAFLDNKGNIRWYGHSEKVDGCLYSNTSYKKTETRGWGTVYSGGYGSYNRWDLGTGYKTTPTKTTIEWYDERKKQKKALRDEVYDDLYTDILEGTHITDYWMLYNKYHNKYPNLFYSDFTELYFSVKDDVERDKKKALALPAECAVAPF